HRLAHLTTDLNILCHVGLYDDGIRAAAPGFEHWHRRTNAVGPCDITGRSHNTALAATDNHRFVCQGGVITFLDGRVKGVAIDGRDAERSCLSMAHQARRAAG